MQYSDFLKQKQLVSPAMGSRVNPSLINNYLFPFQKKLVEWSLRKGRAAVFADTGLGKTLMQIETLRLIGGPCLILSPLAVVRQTVEEGKKIGVDVRYARSQKDASPGGITITNYEMLPHFDPSQFRAVALDESGILKAFEGKTRTALIDAFSETPYRFCYTATPAPNDIAEIANHAAFLGLMSREEMLSAFFVHDDEGWRLKKHAAAGPFWQWLASWSMSVRKPSDIGFEDAGYELPPLSIKPVIIQTNWKPDGSLFASRLHGITERSSVRKDTVIQRVEAAAKLVNDEPDQMWLVWCGLNDESRMMAQAIPGAVEVVGSDSPERKADALHGFAQGKYRVLVSKSSIAGFGMNFQRCCRMCFVGVGDSYETYYQSIRRCWRFGQTKPVDAYIVLSEPEEQIYQNVLRKEKDANLLSNNLLKHVSEFEKEEIGVVSGRDDYNAKKQIALPSWLQGESA